MRARQAGVLIAGLVLGIEAQAAGDPARGSKVFQTCMACHSVTPGEHMTGPSLARIWNRKAGAIEDFLRYSDAMKRADVVWNDANLSMWLANPQRLGAALRNTTDMGFELAASEMVCVEFD